MTTELRGSGLIRLYARTGSRLSWLVPAWAILCGAVASGAIAPTLPHIGRLLLVAALVEAGWGTLWEALGTTDWATPLRRWRNWRLGEAGVTLPYARPDSPAGRVAVGLAQLRSWGETLFMPMAGRELGAVIAGLALTLLLAFALGNEMIVLTVAGLALMQLALLLDRGQGQADARWDGLLRLGLPWLAGHVAFAPLSPVSLLLAALFAVAIADGEQLYGRVAWLVGQLAAALFFVVLHRPLAALFMSLLLVPQVLLVVPPTHRRWQRSAWPWLAAGMLLAALAL